MPDTHEKGGPAFRPGMQHPAVWRDDLNPNPMAGQNVGEAGPHLEEQGATYIDLRDPHRREFTATGDMMASSDNWYVPKAVVDYQLWNRLIGIDNHERLYEAPR